MDIMRVCVYSTAVWPASFRLSDALASIFIFNVLQTPESLPVVDINSMIEIQKSLI